VRDQVAKEAKVKLTKGKKAVPNEQQSTTQKDNHHGPMLRMRTKQ